MRKAIESGVILPITVVLAIFFNFKIFLRGGKPSLAEFLVSIVYIVIWVAIFKLAIRKKEYKIIFTSTVFWLLTCLTSIIALYVNISDAIFSLLIPFVIVFITPFYGLELISMDVITFFILIAIASIYFFYFGVKFLITQRKE